jgi:cytochrome c oxidase subunit 2
VQDRLLQGKTAARVTPAPANGGAGTQPRREDSMEPRRRLEDWHHMLAMISFMAAAAVGLAYLFLHVDLIPHPASMERLLIDDFVQVLFAIAAVFFVVIITVFGYALIFFRRRPGDDSDARDIRGKTQLELTWTIIPLIIVIVLAYYGGRILDEMTATNPDYGTTNSIYSLGAFVPGDVAPADTSQKELEVEVRARRFIWLFGYPGQGIDSTYELVVPVNRRIVFRIQSEDVIHSFWVQQWGPKQDAVPGLSPVLRITPTKTGQYTVECSQLCGYGHTGMTAPVRVVPAGDFDKWVEQQRSIGRTSSPPPGSHVMIDLAAQNIAFDKNTISVPAGIKVMISFDNKDKGIPHNFAVYKTAAAKDLIFSGKIITGPQRITYTFMAPKTPGRYFFRCDVHPKIMTGTFVVT